MAYFKIGDTDFSMCVNGLTVNQKNNYNAQTNAAGDTVVDYINKKRIITVGIIPLDDATMTSLQHHLGHFNVSISFRNPETGVLETDVNCIIPETQVSYYTIQVNKVLYNAFELKFTEL